MPRLLFAGVTHREMPVPSKLSDVRVLVDFDGTIVPGDVTDHIMQSFADKRWLALETEWQSGRMNSRDCMSAQVDLIRASRADIFRAVNERPIDPHFTEFVQLCRARGIPVSVVSDGFDLAIQATFERYGLDLPFYANHLKWLGSNRWRLEFPNRNAECMTGSGNCKCRQAAVSPLRTVVIGDGRSDFCVAARADFVLSKSSLTKHCETVGIPHWPIAGFSEVVARFDGWLHEATRLPPRASSLTARNYSALPTVPPTGVAAHPHPTTINLPKIKQSAPL